MQTVRLTIPQLLTACLRAFLCSCFMASVAWAGDTPEMQAGTPILSYGQPMKIEGGHAIPEVADWNNDGRQDLLVGQYDGGKIRIYLNHGTNSTPSFDRFTYVQAFGVDLHVNNTIAQGASPCVYDWNADGMKDLLVGDSDGKIHIYLNIGTDATPRFEDAVLLTVNEETYDAGGGTMPLVTDWNNDGLHDVLCGDKDGKVQLLLNVGANTAPRFDKVRFIYDGLHELQVDAYSGPCVWDWNFDGRKDLVTGRYDGSVVVFLNQGTDEYPTFYRSIVLKIGDEDLNAGFFTRIAIADWNSDGQPDIIAGNNHGGLQVFHAIPAPPAPPTGVNASDGLFTNKIEIDWKAVQGAKYYRVLRAISPFDEPVPITNWQVSNYHRDYEATPEVIYYYWVQASLSETGYQAGKRSESDWGWRMVKSSLPAPTGLSATNGVYADRVAAAWNPVAGASHYRLYRSIASGGERLPISEWQVETNLTDTTVTIGVVYHYWARAATDASGRDASDFSAEDTGWRLNITSVDPPANVQATDGQYPDRITVTWNRSDNATYYQVFRALDPTAEKEPMTLWVPETEFEDYDVAVETTYYYWVRAATGTHGERGSNFSAAATGWRFDNSSLSSPDGPPHAVNGIYADRIEISWNTAPLATHYRLYRANSEFEPLVPLSPWLPDTSYIDRNVVPDHLYYYAYRAASGSSGQRGSQFSPVDIGWRGLPSKLRYYKVTSKNCFFEGNLADGFDITPTSTNASVKISHLPKGLPKKYSLMEGVLATTKPNVTYMRCIVLENVRVLDNFGKIFSNAPIDTLSVEGELKSLTMKDGALRRLVTQGVGAVKMTSWPNSTDVQNPATLMLQVESSGVSAMKAKISLTGVGLESLFSPEQIIRSIKVAAKKHKASVLKTTYVSFADISGESISARSIGTVLTRGGGIYLNHLLTYEPGGPASLNARYGLFKIGTKTEPRVVVRPGDISIPVLDVTSSKLSLLANGGNISGEMFIVSGEISKVESLLFQTTLTDGSTGYFGGLVGEDLRDEGGNVVKETPYTLFLSGKDRDLTAKDIKKVYGSIGIFGTFMSGADVYHGTANPFMPRRDASIINFGVGKPGVWGEPTIIGESWARTPAKFKGDVGHPYFVQH